MEILESWRSLSVWKQIALIALVICGLEQCAGYFVLPVDGHDASSHLQWITFFRQSIEDGILYPRWMQRGFYGFGAPIFYFYPPLTYFLAAGISFVTKVIDPSELYNLTGAFATLLSFVGCYFLCMQLSLTKRSSLFAAFIYAFGPYRFLDLFIRSALSEHVAMAFLPFLFWGIELTVSAKTSRRKLLGIILTSLAWAAILFTNLPVVAVCAIAMPCYLIFRLRKEELGSVLPIGFGFILGTLLASIYLLPMLHFYPLLNTKDLLGSAHVGSGNVLVDILARKSLSVNLYSSLMLGAVCLIGFHRDNRERSGRGLNAILIFLLALQLPYVFTPLFARVIPFTIIQAPWRCDVILSLVAAVMCAIVWAKREFKRAIWMLMIWFIPSAVFSLLVLFHIQINPHPSMNYASTPAEYMPASIVQLPDSLIAKHASDPVVIFNDSNAQVSSLKLDAQLVQLSIITPRETKATFHDFYWPEWHAELDGTALPIAEDSIGRVITTIPKGRHQIKLLIDNNNPYRMVGRFVTLGAFLSLCLLSLVAIFRRESKVRSKTSPFA